MTANKKVVQIDQYDEVELWAQGKCQIRVRWNIDTRLLEYLVAGPMSLEAEDNTPGIIRALEEHNVR